MKNYPNMRFLVLAFAAMTIFAVSCSDDNAVNNPAPIPNIAQIVAQSPNFTTLQAALVKTNLTGALSSGTLTLFAPDNAAFAASGITDVNAVPVTKLDSILKYHVIGQTFGSAVFPPSDTLKTQLGRNVYASKNANGLFANGIKIKQSDILGSNGVIHVISKVLVPPTQTIAQILSADTSYSFFVAALTTVNLLTTVSGPGKFTVFAPTNAAFRAAGITDITVVPVAILDAVVKYHIVTSNIFTADLVDNTPPVPTLQGGNILRYATPVAGVRIATSVQPISAITTGNIVATNGVIQVINRIMLP